MLTCEGYNYGDYIRILMEWHWQPNSLISSCQYILTAWLWHWQHWHWQYIIDTDIMTLTMIAWYWHRLHDIDTDSMTIDTGSMILAAWHWHWQHDIWHWQHDIDSMTLMLKAWYWHLYSITLTDSGFDNFNLRLIPSLLRSYLSWHGCWLDAIQNAFLKINQTSLAVEVWNQPN